MARYAIFYNSDMIVCYQLQIDTSLINVFTTMCCVLNYNVHLWNK